MEISDWLHRVKPNWLTRLPTPPLSGMPDPLLGREDGGSEWSQPDKPTHLFTFIEW